MEPCLILFDIDETLYSNDEKRIPESTITAINRLHQAGHTLAIATGRAPFDMVEAVKDLPFDLFILANGQVVVRNDEIIYENAIDKATIADLLDIATQSGVYLGFNSATHSSVTGLTDELTTAFQKYYANMPRIAPNADEHDAVYQISFLSEDITAVSERFADKLRFLPWLSHGADVIPTGVSKAAGLREARVILADILPEKIVFFGDGYNDIELMEMADIGIAMGNAVAPLKKIADFVTKDIENDGIFHACEHFNLFAATVKMDEVALRIVALLALIDEDSDVLDYYLELKSLYSGYTRESDKAMQVLKTALRHFPDDIELLIEIAATYEFELEDVDQAKKYYEKVLTLNPDHDLALDALEVLIEQSIH